MILEKLREKFKQKVFGDTTVTSVPDPVIDDYINEAYQHFLILVLPYYRWRVNGEVATTSIVAGQKEYMLPADLVRILTIKVNDVELAEEQYTIFDKSIILEDENLYTDALTDGLEITYQDEYTALSVTTDEPNIPTAFRPYLYKKPSLEYCEDKEMYKKRDRLKITVDEMEAVIKEHYLLKTSRRSMLEPEDQNYY